MEPLFQRVSLLLNFHTVWLSKTFSGKKCVQIRGLPRVYKLLHFWM